MRHQTTAYDQLSIPRIKGKRREVRRELAQISRTVLDLHRRDVPHEIRGCSLCTAIVASVASTAS
jgi:16S rRNA U516 pseudouridylate synthase RsuA-like enzyme